MPFASLASGAAARFQQSLYTLGGRFVAIHWAEPEPHVYLDPCGSLAVVFCPGERIVASSPNLVPYTAGTQDNHALIRAIGVPERDGMYRFGLTPRHGIERLLPNHMLDLSSWTASRHWPSPEDLAVNHDVPNMVSEIGSILQRQIDAVARAYRIHLALTAGRHTRMMLACARSSLDRIALFTIPLPDPLARLDAKVARRIASRFGLRYANMQWEEPTKAETDVWLYRTGSCVAGRTLTTVRTLRQLDAAWCVLSGTFGGVADPKRWRETDFAWSLQLHVVSCADVLDRLQVPALPEIVDRAQRWLERLPTQDIFSTLSLLHLEQNYGSWGGPQDYGPVSSAFILSPFCHRRIVQLMLTLPVPYRWHDRLPRDLIRSRWPQLLDVPFNAPVGMERTVALFKRAMSGGRRYMFSFRRQAGQRQRGEPRGTIGGQR